jgi:hypothetical protein
MGLRGPITHGLLHLHYTQRNRKWFTLSEIPLNPIETLLTQCPFSNIVIVGALEF